MTGSGLRRGLLLLILTEILVSAWLLFAPQPHVMVPESGLTGYHPYTASRLRARSNLNSDHPAALAECIRDHLALGLFESAELLSRRAVTRYPKHPELRYQWAAILAVSGAIEQSDGQLQTAMTLGYSQPDDCLFLLAFNALRRGQPAEADAYLSRCRATPAAKLELARLRILANDPAGAGVLLQDLQQTHPDALRVRQLQGTVARMTGDEPKARLLDDMADVLQGYLESPLTEQRERLVPHYEALSVRNLQLRIFDTLTSLGPEAAMREWKSRPDMPWNPATEDVLADIDYAMGQPDAQIRRLRDIIRRDGPTTYRLLRLGFALQTQNDVAGAVAAMQQAVELNNDTSSDTLIDALSRLAELHESAGDATAARRARARAKLEQSRALLVESRVPEALTAVTASTTLDDNSAAAWYLRSQLESLLGRDQKSLESCRRVVELNPRHGRARARLAASAQTK